MSVSEPFDDAVTRLLANHPDAADLLKVARDALMASLRSEEDVDEPRYLVPDSGTTLSANEMAKEIEDDTAVGRSFVELFVAGGLINKRQPLKEALARMRDEPNAQTDAPNRMAYVRQIVDEFEQTHGVHFTSGVTPFILDSVLVSEEEWQNTYQRGVLDLERLTATLHQLLNAAATHVATVQFRLLEASRRTGGASDFEREKLQERLSKLAGGVAVIKVGDATTTAMKEKKHRVEDALQASRVALEEGIVPGGGVAYLNAADAIRNQLRELNGDEQTGALIILRALEEPLRQLAANAGLEASVVVSDVRSAKRDQGLNIDTGKIEDLFEAGIVDPTMVARSALQNAASIAKNILTTEAIVGEAPEKQSTGAGMPGGMPGMM